MSIKPGDIVRLKHAVMPTRISEPTVYCEPVGLFPSKALKNDTVFIVAMLKKHPAGGYVSIYDRDVIILHHFYGVCCVTISVLEEC